MGTVVRVMFPEAGADPIEVPTDRELVQAAQGGDQQAFGKLVDRYKALVFSMAYSRTGVASLSEDIAQETFLQAWKHLSQFREPFQFRAWVSKIAKHKTSRLGQMHTRPFWADLTTFRSMSPEDSASPVPSPLDQIISREEEVAVWRALRRLPDGYRLPLVLYYQEDCSIDRVAVALDLTRQSVKNRLLRGRRMLRDEMMKVFEVALRRISLKTEFVAGVLAAISLGLASRTSEAADRTGARKGKGMTTRVGSLGVAAIGAGVILATIGGLSLTSNREPQPHQAAWEARQQAFSTAATGMAPPRLTLGGLGERLAESRETLLPQLRRKILDFNFEDGLVPEIGSVGQTTDCPPWGGSLYCMAGEVADNGYLSAVFATKDQLLYSRDLVLTFDYWILGNGFQLQISDPDAGNGESTQYYVTLDRATKGAWAHVDVRLQDALNKGGQAMRPGDRIASLGWVFAGTYRPGQVLYVDNVSVSHEESR